ncbi:MAG TPA: alpha/beta fold hydrolase [Gemmatimonas sp.]|uniref:alpha/beta hydrolase n=1 Tax=Gemmatimonas sp. TaxID=1962908 RepID=UPI002EDACD9C
MTRSRRTWTLVGAVLVALVVLVAVGPVTSVEMPSPSESAGAFVLPYADSLDALIRVVAERERRAGVTDTGVTKRIVFAHDTTVVDSAAVPAHHRTPWSVVYLHGFSATRQETAPLAEDVAAALGANLFETRLRGHGLPGDSLRDVTAHDWLMDAEEALAIGRLLGDTVLLIGTSTGGTLAAWLAEQPRAQRAALGAVVLLAPNFAPRDPAAAVLSWPWANRVLPPFIPYREWTPRNDAQRRYWTVRYPSTVLFPMQALVTHVRSAPLAAYDLPTLVFYSELDEVVNPASTGEWIDRVRMVSEVPVQVMPVDPLAGEDAHVLAGRIMAPGQTAHIRDAIVEFMRRR